MRWLITPFGTIIRRPSGSSYAPGKYNIILCTCKFGVLSSCVCVMMIHIIVVRAYSHEIHGGPINIRSCNYLTGLSPPLIIGLP